MMIELDQIDAFVATAEKLGLVPRLELEIREAVANYIALLQDSPVSVEAAAARLDALFSAIRINSAPDV